MFKLKNILIAPLAVALLACDSVNEEVSITGGTSVAGSSAVVVKTAEGAGDPSLFVFREWNGVFEFISRHDDEWQDNQMSLDLELGEYKFFFSQYAGTTLKLPQPVRKFGDMTYTLSKNPVDNAYYASSGDLFLQDLVPEANKTYSIDGNANVTVTAKLTRAVGQVNVVLKRIEATGEDTYDLVPYDGDGNIMDLVKGIRMVVSDAATSVNVDGGSGSGQVLFTIEDYEAGDIDDDGFAALEGPFVIPPQTGSVKVDLTVETSISGQENIVVPTVTETVRRNQQIIITLLIKDETSLPKIYVEVDVADMEDEHDGKSGLWD